ncbi:UDP-glycosyltransferase 71E1 [Artemisia annua]|uniref:UDP-glycosyltransferase 71E1 n=1 Tax=Artemisia annua TaxID=35608 RepID=A0A2U1NW17_ARTAN|nr:UDP-glycosyltransferase 71E1 [Artemisia annua]
MALITPETLLSNFVEHNKTHVRNIVRENVIESDSVRLAAFVLDMFCMGMADVADEFGVPTYNYFTSGASMLGLMFDLQAKRDEEGHDVTELKDTGLEFSTPSFVNPRPAKVVPDVLLDKRAKMLLDLAKSFRETKGIIINSFTELESHGVEYLMSSNANIPPVFPVGPILNLSKAKNDSKTEEIMTWLNDQPESSVVFLCFGSMGSFSEIQVKEIAIALERSGHRFLWSLRRPQPEGKMEHPKEYENPEEVLPEGFIERTSSAGSIWCGVPIAAWPLYAEQQINAFQLVVELGIAAEIRIDYQSAMRQGNNNMTVAAEEIEDGIRRMMNDHEMRNKVKEMKEKSRLAVLDGGSSYGIYWTLHSPSKYLTCMHVCNFSL